MRKAVTMGLAGAALIALAAPMVSAAPTYPVNNKGNTVRTGGSDTTYALLNDLGSLFNEAPGCIVETATVKPLDGTCVDFNTGEAGIQPQYLNGIDNANPDHEVLFNYYPVGSSTGITQLCQQNQGSTLFIEIARSSRAPRAADCDGLRFVAFAKDAIPWVNFRDVAGSPAAGVSNLTQTQVRNIFNTCTVTNWNQVGGSAGPIAVWTAQAGSGTRTTFDGFLGSGANSENCIPAALKDGNQANGERVIFENNATPIITSDAADCGALPAPCEESSIFPYSLGRWNQSGGEGSSVGSLDGFAPNEANVISGDYAYSRFVYNAFRAEAPLVATTLAGNAVRSIAAHNGFICRRDAQQQIDPITGQNFGALVTQTIEDNGFFGLPEGATGGGQTYTGKCRVTDTNDI